jgi:antitoxin component of RelBE/YafQ-DinJ toxin-antitoxin module
MYAIIVIEGKDMAIIYLRIDDSEKRALEWEAKKLGMQLTTYCRMILIKSLQEKDEKKS